MANECEYHLGPSGYRWVQVSPPQEHVTGHSWWVDYQVELPHCQLAITTQELKVVTEHDAKVSHEQAVSYALESKRGTPDQFASMVQRCNLAGVGVIVDA